MIFLTIELKSDWWEFATEIQRNTMKRLGFDEGNVVIKIENRSDLNNLPIKTDDIIHIDVGYNSPVMSYLMLESRGLRFLKKPKDGRLRFSGDDAVFIFNNLDLYSIL